MENEARLATTWEAAAYDREKGEWVHTELHSYEHPEAVEPFPAATPARITPSRRKPIERDYTTLFVFSDAQIGYRRVLDYDTQQDELIPLHDERAMAVARFICRDLQPEYIINLGDSVDLASLSRFKKDSDHFGRELGPSFQRIHDYYAELRADNPQARMIEVDSNHNVRLKDYVLKNAPELYNMRRAGAEKDEYPVMTYPYLANLGHLGVEWYGGYGAAQFQYNDDLVFKHGDLSVSRGSTAAKLSSLNPDLNVVQGHAHRTERHTRTTRTGRYLSALVVGPLCRTTGEVSGYHSAVDDMNQVVPHQENWNQSVLVVRDYGEGQYQFDQILIHDGRAFYNGKEYTDGG